MNVSLTPELEKMIHEKVTSGMYQSASEVVREGLRLLKEQDDIRKMRLEALRKEIVIGTNQLNNGDFTTYSSGKEVVEKIKTEGRQQIDSTKKVEA